MDYLKAFTIGTSGLVTFSLLSDLASNNKYDYSKDYSFIIPIYYGLMTIIVFYIAKSNKLSLRYRLFIISILSSIIIIITNYKLNKYEKVNDKNNHIFLINQDIIRQLIIFNIIIFYVINNFSKSEMIKYFIVGSSIFSYGLNYYSISQGASLSAGDNKKGQIVKYDYKYFVITEPFIQGISLMIGLYIGTKILKINLLLSLVAYHIIASIIMTMIAYKTKIYDIQGKEWINKYLMGLLKMSVIKVIVQYYLIKNLK